MSKIPTLFKSTAMSGAMVDVRREQAPLREALEKYTVGPRLTRRDLPRAKRYHFAAKINSNGDVSAFCFTTPRAINLKVASWTNRAEAVTCPKCRGLLAKLTDADARA